VRRRLPDERVRRNARRSPGHRPAADCQACFLCEAYCPADALYVAPFHGPVADLPPDSVRPSGTAAAALNADVDEARLAAAGRFGEYRRWLGWGAGRRPGALRDANAELPELAAIHRGDVTFRWVQ
jgi:ferredoxin